MNFLRSFCFNFLAVFFINNIAPGIEVGIYEQVPNIWADLLFSLIVGLMNASIFPLLFIMELGPTPKKIAFVSGIFSFSSFIALLFLPFGIQINSFLGVLLGGTFVWGASFLTNYLEWRQDIQKP